MAVSSVSNAGVQEPVVSVASTSSSAAAGGSVIDVSSLVSQLVTATYAAQSANNASQTSAVTAQISALGTLKSALSTFQSALSALDTPQSFNALAATSSDTSAFTASAQSGAVAGTYNVAITQLAQAQQLVSKNVASDGNTAVGTGSLTLSLGSQSMNVNIDSTDNTLSGIAAAINSASGNPGISATVIQGSDGAHLVLASALTGGGNTITVSTSGGDGGLAQLAYSSTSTGNYTQASKPQDAIVSVAGVSYDSASNTVSNAISGVTLNLLSMPAAGTSTTLTVSNDTTTVASNISAFVAAYNTLVQQFSSLGGYDASSGTAGPMLGSALLSGIQSQIGQVVHGLISGASGYNSLASIGVTTQSDGTLALNTTTLQTALSSNFNAVSQLFSGTNGIGTQLNTQLTSDLAANTGPVDSYSKTLVQQNNQLSQQASDLTNEEAALTASMTEQFSALNTLLSQLQTTSAYLTQAFADLPKVGNNNSG
jgi:flagellar hook-associated protein 2